MWITRTSIDNPVFATMVMIGITVLGLFSYLRLNVEQMPDVTLPYVMILTPYPGAAPEAVENDVTKPVEYAVNQVPGVKDILSNSLEGQSQVFVQFRLSTNVAQAVQDVRDKLAPVRTAFPRDVKDPLVTRVDNQNSQPVVSLAVTSPTTGLRELTSLTDQTIVKALENLPGVARIDISGRVTRQILIQVRPEALAALGIGVDQVMNAIRDANQDVPAGRITRGARDEVVRVDGKIKDPSQFGRIVVARQGGGAVYLSQVASVIDGEKDPDSISRINGHPAITLDIQKAQDANIVETGRNIRAAVAVLKARLPSDVDLRITYSNADEVQSSVYRVMSTIVEGGVLTVLIVFLFLGSWRSTIITGLTLPLAVVATFIALHAFGFTLNFLTLMALSLTIGLLIDDAIVVRENIVRHLALGKDHVTAAREGTEEIGLAVMATTFAIVAVFVPIAFMSGVIGRFFFQFGVTVAVAVLVSLFVSFTLDPMLSSVWHDPPETRFRRAPWLGRLLAWIQRLIDGVHAIYADVLRWALGHRKSVLAIALGSFVASFLIVPLVGTEFIPEVDQGFISLRLNTPVGSSLEYTNAKVAEAEQVLKRFPEISMAMTSIGTDSGRNYARVNLKLTDRSKRARSQKDLEGAIRKALKPIPGIELALGYDRPIWFNVLGPDPETLSRLARTFADRIAGIRGIADLETSDKVANPALSIRLNNDAAADLGITVQQVGATIRPLVAGDTISYWLAPDGQNYEVNVQLSKSDRQVASDIGNLYLTTNRRGPDGQKRMVPLRQVADIVPSTSPQIIKREDLERRIGIYANAEGRPSGDVGSDVQKVADAMQLPPGYRLQAAGQQQDMQDSFKAALAALGLAVIFIYLMGLVTKNAILLVDFANRSRRAGASVADALLTAGQVRLRPILMTTAAMIGGMLPLALGLGDGGEQQAPMGRAIIGGVVTSTLLTLIVVPVLYTYLDALHQRRLRRKALRGASGVLPAIARGADD